MRTGRSIGERRELLEKAEERERIHRKIKRKQISRIILTVIGFTAVGVLLFYIGTFFTHEGREELSSSSSSVIIPYSPTIPIEDQDSGSPNHITARMREYIGQAEADFKEIGLKPQKAVIPTGAIREVDFYFDDQPGFIKTTIDRGTGVTVEDADRMLRYLASQGITTYEYIDLRIDGRAYWK